MPPIAETPKVLVIGDVMTDVIVRPEGPVVIGSDRRAEIALSPGGSGCNQAAWLAHLGVPVGFIGRVGAGDVESQTRALEAAGVTPYLAGDPARATGMLIALIDPDGERSFLTDRGANAALSEADLDGVPLDGVELLHVSGYALFAPGPRRAVMDFMGRARSRGIMVTVDPGSVGFLEEVGPRNFLDWASSASAIFPNAEEGACLTSAGSTDEQMRALLERFELVVIKRGAAGAMAGRGAGRWSVPAETADVIDTTGAGDAFLAGFIAGRLAGEDIEHCLRRGVEAGTEATRRVGGRPVYSP